MDGWEDLAVGRDAHAIASRIIAECTTFNFAALRDNPLGAVMGSVGIEVEIEDGLIKTGCGGGGYYRPKPPTIHLHPATYRRDNFTVLHELGHHLQQTHDQWGFTLIDMAERERRDIEEKVCDQFAAQVLMPVSDTDRHATSLHPADVMAGLFARWEASRSAILQRVREMMPQGARWLLAVSDLDGVVITSATTYDDPQPPKGLVQEGFRRVAVEAVDAAVRREFHEGIEYKTGSVLDGMRVEAALDRGALRVPRPAADDRERGGHVDVPLPGMLQPSVRKGISGYVVKRPLRDLSRLQVSALPPMRMHRARTSREVRYVFSAVYTSRDGIWESRVLVTPEGRQTFAGRDEKHLLAVAHHRYA